MTYSEGLYRRIPLLRRWVSKSQTARRRRRLLRAYETFQHAVTQEGVDQVRFDHQGCIFTLRDGRQYLFNPLHAAGWLYSVPYTGTFERKETEYLANVTAPGWVCIDVGACFGWYTVLFSRRVGQYGHVHAFEPVPVNYKCVSDNLALNQCQNVTLNDFALGDSSGRFQMFLPERGVSASLQPHASLGNCKLIEATVIPLDHYLEKGGLSRIDLIKADIEGAELPFLRGATNALQRYKPILMLEIQAHSTSLFGYQPLEVFTFLANLGYESYYVSTEATLIPYIPDQSSGLPDYNFIFHHKDRLT
jgi:FkbM family methyltransferase